MSPEAEFSLDPRLVADCHDLGQLPLCQVLLMNDSRFAWCILVPRCPGLRELHELTGADRDQIWAESEAVSRAMLAAFSPDKLNIAALGNVVEQLHLHHVARTRTDAAWPAPVWGHGTREPLTGAARTKRVRQLQEAGITDMRWMTDDMF